jgi:hypothetical protein
MTASDQFPAERRKVADENAVTPDSVSAALSKTLHKESRQIELFSYALWTLRSSLQDPSKTTYQQGASDDIEKIVSDLRSLELPRAIHAATLAGIYNLPEEASLLSLAHAAGEPWNELLAAHHQHLTTNIAHVDAHTHIIKEHIATDIHNSLANRAASQTVPRSLTWFLRSPFEEPNQ